MKTFQSIASQFLSQKRDTFYHVTEYKNKLFLIKNKMSKNVSTEGEKKSPDSQVSPSIKINKTSKFLFKIFWIPDPGPGHPWQDFPT